MAIKTISQFDAATPASNDKILFEQNGEGKSTTIGNAVNTCSLTYEEIMASADLSGKVASASALKLLNNYFNYNYSYLPDYNVYGNGLRFYLSDLNTIGRPIDEYCLVISFAPVNDVSYGIQIAISYNSQVAYIRRKWAEWGSWKQISN